MEVASLLFSFLLDLRRVMVVIAMGADSVVDAACCVELDNDNGVVLLQRTSSLFLLCRGVMQGMVA
jgi:hypothetical protein